MKSYVITIKGHEKSEASASRCIKSGYANGIDLRTFDAITPKDNVVQLAKECNVPLQNFIERYSRSNNCVAAFLSHYTLWKRCVSTGETFNIFEHDAIINGLVKDHAKNITASSPMCLNLGFPSYGKYKTPDTLGINPLTSKRYFPGAHAYQINPVGAQALIEQVPLNGRPTDLFLNLDIFPWLTELYPWVAEAKDSFTTIQNHTGCRAKHNYNESYEISEVL